MAYSELLYTGDGVTTDYSVTFEYLDQSHVRVAVDKVLTSSVGSNYKFEFINGTTIRVRTVVDENPVPAGLEIRVFRQTPIDNPAVVFGGGASLSSANLNKNSEYLTFALQEATDDNDAFTLRYLGAFSVAPTTDNSGGTLIVGAMYFDIDEDALYFWNGTEWKKGDLLEASLAARDAAQASANAAATSETNAATSAANLSASETAAATSASAAATSETNAANSASAAATSETNAASSETAASTSETNAAASETAAATSETNAASSASAASTSETNAAASETNAATSETNAAASEAAAAASFDNFDERYLGAKASDPSLDNDGEALLPGALYFNTNANDMRVYNGAAWNVIAVDALGDLSDVDTTGAASGDGLVFDGTAWNPGPAGGGMFKGDNGTVGSRAGDIFRVNEQTLNTDVTIDADENANATGPLTVASGFTLTVTSGGNLSIV